MVAYDAAKGGTEALTRATGLFHEDEVATAVELLDESLAGDEDYRFLGAYDAATLVGWACWGPTPGTRGTHDLYWIAVDPERQGQGVGSQLLGAVEQDAGCVNLIEVSEAGEPLVRLINYTPANPLKRGMELSTLEMLYRQYLAGRHA